MSTVLIVDDAELFREALKAAFTQEGFEVVAVDVEFTPEQEAALHARFGREYLAYREAVPRWL